MNEASTNSTTYDLTSQTTYLSTKDLDAIILCILTGLGLFGNLSMILMIILRRSMRKVVNMFLLHHCFINFVQCILFIPFILALLNESHMLKGCEIIGGLYVTMVTATVLNIAAMTACEAYRFEDLIQEQNTIFNSSDKTQTLKDAKKHLNNNINNLQSQDINSNGTGSYTCVIFGLFMIWMSSIILHLGMTLIGSDAKQFYNHKVRNCFLVIGDQQTYILYIMWILLTIVSLILTIIYVKRIYADISKKKFQDNSNFFITSPRFYELKKSEKLAKFERESKLDTCNTLSCTSSQKIRLYNKNCKSSKSCESLNINPLTSAKVCGAYSPPGLTQSKSLANFNINTNSRSTSKKSNTNQTKIKRRFDIVKLILQRIKIQCIVIKLFIICWMPLFFTVLIDTRFKVSPNVYRYLILIAFSNSSLTPYCYMTILIPQINKYCMPCMRTDGKQSKKKTMYYDAMEKYYEKLGDRMHNISGSSSLNSLNMMHHSISISPANKKLKLWEEQTATDNQEDTFKFLGVNSHDQKENGKTINYLSNVHVSKFGGNRPNFDAKKSILKLNKYEG